MLRGEHHARRGAPEHVAPPGRGSRRELIHAQPSKSRRDRGTTPRAKRGTEHQRAVVHPRRVGEAPPISTDPLDIPNYWVEPMQAWPSAKLPLGSRDPVKKMLPAIVLGGDDEEAFEGRQLEVLQSRLSKTLRASLGDNF